MHERYRPNMPIYFEYGFIELKHIEDSKLLQF